MNVPSSTERSPWLKGGQASRLSVSAKLTEGPRSRWRACWTGETRALLFRQPGPRGSVQSLMFAAVFGLAVSLLTACHTPRTDLTSAEAQIRALLSQQERDWNAGNLSAFMEGYAKADTTRFASGGNVFHGWQTVFDRYRKKYADPSAMGTTT